MANDPSKSFIPKTGAVGQWHPLGKPHLRWRRTASDSGGVVATRSRGLSKGGAPARGGRTGFGLMLFAALGALVSAAISTLGVALAAFCAGGIAREGSTCRKHARNGQCQKRFHGFAFLVNVRCLTRIRGLDRGVTTGAGRWRGRLVGAGDSKVVHRAKQQRANQRRQKRGMSIRCGCHGHHRRWCAWRTGAGRAWSTGLGQIGLTAGLAATGIIHHRNRTGHHRSSRCDGQHAGTCRKE
jgi:hypothetical protein